MPCFSRHPTNRLNKLVRVSHVDELASVLQAVYVESSAINVILLFVTFDRIEPVRGDIPHNSSGAGFGAGSMANLRDFR